MTNIVCYDITRKTKAVCHFSLVKESDVVVFKPAPCCTEPEESREMEELVLQHILSKTVLIKILSLRSPYASQTFKFANATQIDCARNSPGPAVAPGQY